MFVSLTGLGMSKSTVHRLLASMCARHHVEKNENHTYSIGCDVIYLEKLDVYPNTMLYTQVGFRSPAYCSSMGKCLLSCLSGDELEDALYGCTFKKYTPNTITDIREFKKYLRSVRCQDGRWMTKNTSWVIDVSVRRCMTTAALPWLLSAPAALSDNCRTIFWIP